VLFTGSPSYAETFEVVNSSGVGFDTFDPAYAYNYNPKTGAAALMQALSPAAIQALQEELARYAGLWQKSFAPIGVSGYKASSVVLLPAKHTMVLTRICRMAFPKNLLSLPKNGYSQTSFPS
jgi:hypothetical protein